MTAMLPTDLPAKLEEIRALLADRLDVRGRTLAQTAAAARGRVPRALRRDLALLVEAEPRAANPKLALKSDLAALGAAHARLQRGLAKLPQGKYARRTRSALIARIAGQILTVLLLVLLFVHWRGLL